MSTESTSLREEGAARAGRSRFFARVISQLVAPPRHGRKVSALIVLAMAGLVGWFYVVADGVVSLQVFYLLPLILAVGWLGFGWGVGMALFSALLRFWGDVANSPEHVEFFASQNLVRTFSNRLNGFLVHLVVVVVIHELLQISRQLEARVQARTTALRREVEAKERLQKSLLEAGLRERREIGRDLHDGLGQHLAATAMAASILAKRLAGRGDALAEDARQVEDLVKAGIDQSRLIARGLLLETVRPEDLFSELEELAATATHQHGTPCVLSAEGGAERLDVQSASHLFYIAREALRNALKHSGASRIKIHFSVGRVLAALSVTDNGRGIPQEKIAAGPGAGGMGLHIMAQRTELIGGKLQVVAGPAGGTRVDCRVPLGIGA